MAARGAGSPSAVQLEGSPRAASVVRLLPLLMGAWLGAMPGLAQQHVPLECRVDTGSWARCTMRVERIGEHWWIQSGGQRIEFRHDGRGAITMRRSQTSAWQTVSANWMADAVLCWDGICARGAIPLD